MAKITVFIVLALLAGVAVSDTFTSSSATAASFNATPTLVFTSANTTGTGNTDAKITAPGVQGVTFGAGATNDTIWVYGVQLSTANVLTGVVVRKVSATIAGYGNDTTEQSVIAADTVVATSTPTGTITLRATPVSATGLGIYALGAVVSGGNTGMDVLYLYTYSAGALSQSVAVVTSTTANTISTTSGTAGNAYSYAIGNIWQEDGVFYIIYETIVVAYSGTTVGNNYVTAISLQSYGATNGSATYTKALSVATFSGTTTAGTGYNTVTGPMGGMSNYTGSMYIQVAYAVPNVGSTAGALWYGTFVRVGGAAGTPAIASVATNVIQSATAAGVTYYVAGFLGSNATFGGFLGNITVAKGSPAPTAFIAGDMASVNGSVSATSLLALNNGTSSTGGVMTSGYRYGAGFVLISSATGTAPANTFTYQTFLANGTLNGTATPVNIGSFSGPVSTFIDVNGALWIGYYTQDTTTSSPTAGPGMGYVGKLISQVNYYNATANATKAANVLATFAAILSFVIASLFMF